MNPLFAATGDHTQMTRASRFNLLLPSRLAACCALVSLVFLLGALITPWGLVTSHGAAELSSKQHADLSEDSDLHAHSHEHEDEEASTGAGHVHHGGDHSHEVAHALPTALTTLGLAAPIWLARLSFPMPSPALAGLDRPPKG